MKNKDKNTLIQLQDLLVDDFENDLEHAYTLISLDSIAMCNDSREIRGLKTELTDSQTISILFSVIGLLSGLAIGLLI